MESKWPAWLSWVDEQSARMSADELSRPQPLESIERLSKSFA